MRRTKNDFLCLFAMNAECIFAHATVSNIRLTEILRDIETDMVTMRNFACTPSIVSIFIRNA